MTTPTNTQKGWWGYEAIKEHQRVKGFDTRYIDLSITVFAEVMSDILHYADMEGFDAEKLVLKALKYYQEEKEDNL